MIKKSTLLILLGAIVLGATVYYFEFKRDKKEKPAPDTSKPAFSIQATDVVSFTIRHPQQSGDSPIRFEKHGEEWQIVQPVQTEADQAAADGIVDQLSGSRVTQTQSGDADRRHAYGLDPPQVSLEFTLRSGARHTLLVGDKDFSGDSVYTVVDGGKSVSLLPESISTSVVKPLDNLRDRTILHITSAQIASFSLRNASGDLAVSKEKDAWKFVKPAGALAANDAVDSLLETVVAARMISVAGEKPENLARYGLASPPITFTASDAKGTKSTLIVGKKDGNTYFARDLSRPMIFRVPQDVYDKLVERFADLRDKKLIHTDLAEIQRIQIHDSAGAIVVSRKKENADQWAFESPDDQKGKLVASWKILDPIGNLRGEEVIDQPSAGLVAQLANPAIRVVFTGKDGRELTLRISKPSGEFVYAQASDGASLYKLKKNVVDDLDVKPADLVLGDASPN